MTEAETVTVETLRYHTLDGEAHDVGEIYEARADVIETLVAQGMAVPTALQPIAMPRDPTTPSGETKRRR